MFRKLKVFFNNIFNSHVDFNNDSFWQTKKIDNYKFVSKTERSDTLLKLQHKYPMFSDACRIYQWVEMWNTMSIKDGEYKAMFLRDFEDAIKNLGDKYIALTIEEMERMK